METRIPSKFVRLTRWAYIKDGIEVGPYDAHEMIELLQKREIRPDTTVLELNTRRMCPVREVGPFANVIVSIVQEDDRRRADMEVVEAADRAARSGRNRLLFYSVFFTVVGVVGVAAFLFLDPFNVVHREPPKFERPAPKVKEQKLKEPPKEPEFKITEMDPSEMDEDPELELIESVLEERKLTPTAEALAAEEKLEGPIQFASKKVPRVRVKKESMGPASAGGDDSGITTFDFSEEEIGLEEGPSGPDDRLAISRLRKVMRQCVVRSLAKFPEGEEVLIDAQATLQPDGRLTGLKIDLMPRKAVGEVKMCVSAELMRMRVPAFEGNPVPISTALAVPGR